MIFEANFAIEDSGGAKYEALKAVQKKLGASETEFAKKYFEEYKKKHDHVEEIDKFLAKAIPYWESHGGSASPLPFEEAKIVEALPNDEEISRNALFNATKDKPGFFAAVQEVLEKERKPDAVEELEQLTINDDGATGHAAITIDRSGDSVPSLEKMDLTIKFRRLNGGWLIDSFQKRGA